jgi:hypothetical protein
MKTYNATDTIKKVSFLLEREARFAFVTYTRSAIFSLTGELTGEKKPPKNFTRLVADSLKNQSNEFIKAANRDLVKSNSEKIKENSEVDISKSYFYDPGFLEYYINTNYDVFKTFVSWYLKTTPVVVVSFQSQLNISKYFSKESVYINAPYNDFYSKIDEITNEIEKHKDKTNLCVLDCPMLSTALAQSIWEKGSMSIFDLGRTLTVAKSTHRSK